jgi:hypothetical protein
MRAHWIRCKWPNTLVIVQFFMRLTRCLGQYAIPFVISLYDYWRNQRSRQVDRYVPTQRFEELPLQVVYSVPRRSFYYLTQSRFRGLIAAAFLSAGGLLASSLSAGTRSTYVCPIVVYGASGLRSYKLFNVLADSVILIGVTELCRSGAQFDDTRRKRALAFLGAGLLVSGQLQLY